MKAMNVGILFFDDVEVLDFAGPFEVFSRTRLQAGVESRRSNAGAPFNVYGVARVKGPIFATGGLVVVPTYGFSDCPPIDLLVVPGGWGTRKLLEDEELLTWIKKAASNAATVTSVCSGSLLLAKAGLLQGKAATTHWGALDTLASIDPTIRVERQQRVVDSEIITSAGISAGIDMALHVVERILGADVANDTARYMEYRRA
jgi:transcriptional regulator GlxA family with amidase domain